MTRECHNLNQVDGKTAFYSLRESAWHKLGQVVDRPVTDDEAIVLAGLNWTADAKPIYHGDHQTIPTNKVIIRSDTQECLGIVGSGYEAVQNKDLFAWFRSLDGFADVTIETAGALGAGEVVWVLAKCNGLRFDIKGDLHQGFVSLTNGHAGNKKLMLTPTIIRQCCQNTTRMIVGQKRSNTLASGWELRHTANIGQHMDRIRELYARTTDSWKATEEVLRTLANKPLTDEALTRLFTEPWSEPKTGANAGDFSNAPIAGIAAAEREMDGEAGNESERASLLREMRVQSLNKILAGETCQQPGTKDTLFSAYNAVTEFVEYESSTRVAKTTPKDQIKRAVALKRFESANFGGNGDRVKTRAFKLALELAEA